MVNIISSYSTTVQKDFDFEYQSTLHTSNWLFQKRSCNPLVGDVNGKLSGERGTLVVGRGYTKN